MHGLFGEIQISEEPHERRQNPARFQSVKSLNGPAELFGHKRRHLLQISKRTGSEQLRAGLLTYNSTPAIALIEGLQRGVSIGPRKRRIAINPRIVGNAETIVSRPRVKSRQCVEVSRIFLCSVSRPLSESVSLLANSIN